MTPRSAIRRLALLLSAAFLAVAVVPVRAADGLSELDRLELRSSYTLLNNQFYQKIDPQVLLDGAYEKLAQDLEQKGVARVALAPMHAVRDSRADARTFVNETVAAYQLAGGKLGATEITYDAISGLFGATKDRYTVFLTPKEYADMQKGLSGGDAFGGVGIVLGAETEGLKRAFVQWVAQGGPADRAGLQPGDVLATIDDKPTAGMEVKGVSALLRGTPGTVVHVSIERAGLPLAPIAITRREVHTPTVFAKMLPNNVAFVALTIFGQTTGDELARALDKFEKAGAQAYVLDLRDNGGGYLDAAIEVSSKFIATGPIVKVTERAGNFRQYDAGNSAIAPKPLVVLVNKNTASASEITSGALQDRGVGTLIGTKTFGKGVVQSIYPLPDGSAIKITTARYFTPRGRDINAVGIQPDIVTEENASAIYGDPSKDSQLQAALLFIAQKVARSN